MDWSRPAYPPGMRPLLLACALAACAADPVLLPDSGPCSSACGAGTVCSGGACVAVDGGVALDTGWPWADAVGDDRMALPDFGPRDTGVDAGSVDTGTVDAGVDVPTVDAGRCPNGPTAMCDGRYIDLVSGERDGGVVHFCGACNVTCAAGEVCDACRCAR